MTVWILVQSIRYEGDSILGVFATESAAEHTAERYREKDREFRITCFRYEATEYEVHE